MIVRGGAGTAVSAAFRALLAALLLLSGGLLSACSSHDTSRPDLREVRKLLAAHAAAVGDSDRSAFAADLDTSDQAARFRRAQLAAYANLVRLPLSAWSYQVESRTDDAQAERQAGRRLHADAIIVRISLRYALRGVDRIPARQVLWWTFVRRDGRVVIAADDSLAARGGGSWRGPWDFGRLTVVRGEHSLVLGHPENAELVRAVATVVDGSVPAVSAVWGTSWQQRVAVFVPADQDELSAEVGQASEATLEVAAAAISGGEDPLTGDVFGQRLVVNPDVLQRLTAVGRQITIRHEITHIAAADRTSPATPQWLIEGFAEYVGNLGSGQPVPIAARELAADVRRGRLPTRLPEAADFSTAGLSAQAYQESWLACRLIARSVGAHGLARFYRLVGESPASSAAAVAAATRAVLHMSPAQFTRSWRAYVRDQLS